MSARAESPVLAARWQTASIVVPLVIAGSIGAATLCRWVLPGDPAELVTAAVTLGLAHPTGYPLYLLVAKVASLATPWLRPELAINTLSLVCMLAMLGVAGRSLALLGFGAIAITTSLLLLAFTPSVWRYSTYAEVYALHGLLMSMLILALVRAGERRRGAALAAYLVGLSTGAHMTGLLALPAFGAWFVLDERRSAGGWRPGLRARLARLAVGFLLGATVLLVLFLFDRSDRLNYLHGIEVWRPDLGLDSPWSRFVYIVSARQFEAVAGIASGVSSGFVGGLREVVTKVLGDDPVLIVLGAVGLCVPFGARGRRSSAVHLYLVILIVLQLLYFATYRRFFQPIFFLPGSIALTFGVANLLERGVRGSPRIVAALGIAAWVAFGIARHYASRDLAHESAPQVATAEVLAALEPDAVVFSTWTSSTLFWFHQWVEDVNPGVEVVNALPEEWAGRRQQFAGRPLYFEKLPPGIQPEALIPFRGLHKLRPGTPPGTNP